MWMWRGGVGLPELVAGVVSAGEGEEGDDACHVHDDHGPEGRQIAQRVGKNAAYEYAQAHAYVPRNQDAGVGGATLVVTSQIDEHILECRPHMTVAQADENGRAIVTNVVGADHKQGVAHHRDAHATTGILHDFALSQRLGTLQSREHEPDGNEHEPCARATGAMQHLLAVDGEVVAQHAKAESEARHANGENPARSEEEAVQ